MQRHKSHAPQAASSGSRHATNPQVIPAHGLYRSGLSDIWRRTCASRQPCRQNLTARRAAQLCPFVAHGTEPSMVVQASLHPRGQRLPVALTASLAALTSYQFLVATLNMHGIYIGRGTQATRPRATSWPCDAPSTIGHSIG